jgi:hypothetical protein
MKIVQVTKEKNTVIYRAFELAFELEKYLQGILHTDDCICGEAFEIWFTDNTNESIVDRLFLYSSMLDFGSFVREQDHRNVILYIVENTNFPENYHGVYVSNVFTVFEVVDKINQLSSRMVDGCFHDIIANMAKLQQ